MTCKEICRKGTRSCTFSGDGCVGRIFDTAKEQVEYFVNNQTKAYEFDDLVQNHRVLDVKERMYFILIK